MTRRISSTQQIEHSEPGILDRSFREMADILPDAMFILSEARQILFINSAAQEMFGVLAAEVIGQNLDIFIPEQYNAVHGDHPFNLRLDEGDTFRLGENRIIYGKHQAGHLIPLDIFVSRRKYQSQIYFICALRDSSDQLAFEQALSESEQRYRGMIESQNTLVVRVDRQGRFIFANQAYCQMFGKSLEELIGKSYTPLVHPDDLPRTLEAMKGLETAPYRISVEQRAMTPKGWRWIAWEDSVIQDAAKSFYEIQAVGVDVTEHKNIEVELFNKITLLTSLLNSIPDLVFFKDASGAYQGCNPEFARFVGRPVEEIVNKTDDDLFEPEIANSFKETDRKMMAQGKQRHNEEWIKYQNGEEILLETLKAPVHGMDGKTIGILGISRDITIRKKAEEVVILERNLAIILAQKSTLVEALPLCLDLALKVSDMDCGGIYLLDRQKQELVLTTHTGLSDEFVAQSSKFKNDSSQYQLVMKSVLIYQSYEQIPVNKHSKALDESLHFAAIIPVRFHDEVIACINVASHKLDDMPAYRRSALENLALQIGNMIARIQAQSELAESQSELQSMFDSLMDYLFVLDDQGAIIQVNQKVLDGLGYSKQELIGASVLKVHPPEQHATAWQLVQAMLAGLVDTCPLNLVKKDGSTIPVETKVARGRWGNRDVLIGVSRDITERKAA